MFESPTITWRLLVDVLRPLADAVVHAVLCLEDLSRSAVDLPRHQERDELFGQIVEVDIAIDEVVLVTAVAVSDEIRVVLEDRQFPGDPFLADLLLSVVL
jgi:hypothetical protein